MESQIESDKKEFNRLFLDIQSKDLELTEARKKKAEARKKLKMFLHDRAEGSGNPVSHYLHQAVSVL